MGELAGGAAGPVAVIWLVGAYFSQREELRETRDELARQASAQEGALRASLAQQILTRIPVAKEVLFQKFWRLLRGSDQTQHGYEGRDLEYAVRHVRLSDKHQMYGTKADMYREYVDRGVVEAIAFALREIDGLTRAADIADPDGALKALVEQSLAAHEIVAMQTRVQGWIEEPSVIE